MDRFEELRQNRGAMKEFFATKGWEILLKWASESVAKDFEDAIRNPDALERETARVRGLAKEEFIRLPFFLDEQSQITTDTEAPRNP